MVIDTGIRLVKFGDIKPGIVFDYDGKIFMRVNSIEVMDTDGKDETVCNAVDLTNGDYEVFHDNDDVIVYYNAKVVLR